MSVGRRKMQRSPSESIGEVDIVKMTVRTVWTDALISPVKQRPDRNHVTTGSELVNQRPPTCLDLEIDLGGKDPGLYGCQLGPEKFGGRSTLGSRSAYPGFPFFLRSLSGSRT